MKKILPLLFTLLAFCCFLQSVFGQVGTNTISAYINGVSKTFNTITTAQHTSQAADHTLTITGSTNNYNGDDITITVHGNMPVTVGTYTLGLAGSGAYTPGLSYIEHGSTYQPDKLHVSPITITITAISSTHVQGSFKGTLFLSSGGGAANVEITNGRFDVDLR